MPEKEQAVALANRVLDEKERKEFSNLLKTYHAAIVRFCLHDDIPGVDVKVDQAEGKLFAWLARSRRKTEEK